LALDDVGLEGRSAGPFGSVSSVPRSAQKESFSRQARSGKWVRGTLYISGQGGEDATGKIPGDFEAEVKQSLDSIGVVLKEDGMSAADVVSVQVYLTDVDTFERMNKAYTSYFKDPRPTRTTVVVAKLVGAGRIEITATARK
jgi:2-iminobutanoate/2-iminopropanoate deaminase